MSFAAGGTSTERGSRCGIEKRKLVFELRRRTLSKQGLPQCKSIVQVRHELIGELEFAAVLDAILPVRKFNIVLHIFYRNRFQFLDL